MNEVFCPSSGLYFVFGNVSVEHVHTEDQLQTLDVLYAGRYLQHIRYSDVWYSAFSEKDRRLSIDLAERLPVYAILETKHHSAYLRMLMDGVRNPGAFLQEAEKAGCHLFLHYVGESDEYAVLAREVCVNDE